MKLKLVVGFSLILFFLLGMSIIVMGLVKTSSEFILFYFPFTLATLFLIVFASRKSFEEKDFSIALAMILFIALALTFFLSDVKAYEIKNQEFLESNQNLANQLNNLTQTNAYYTDYLGYLKNQVNLIQENSEKIQGQINLIIESQKVPPTENVTPVNDTQNIPQQIPEQRHEEDDDD